MEAGCSSVGWFGDSVLGGVVGDLYGSMLDFWLVSYCWWLGVISCWGTISSTSVALIVLIVFRCMVIICYAIMSSHVFINVVWNPFRILFTLSLIVVVVVILFSLVILSIVDLLSCLSASSSSFQEDVVSC